MNPVQVTFGGPMSDRDRALCEEFGLQIEPASPVSWSLVRVAGKLQLSSPKTMGALQLVMDLARGPLALRLRTARRDEPLARAVGVGKRQPTVLDATAGLGRDALVLAKLGAAVRAIDQIPVLAVLLADALVDSTLRERLSIECADAREVLRDVSTLSTEQRPDVVYLDPMFEAHGKAQVKKDAQILRLLAGPADDSTELFALASTAARERVVVKRHRDMPPLGEPTFVVQGERVRFDVHLITEGP